MPYKSKAQQRAFHAKEAAGEISPKVVAEFDAASKGKKLPEKVSKRKGAGSHDHTGRRKGDSE